jgi:hypothetical protein
VDIRGWARPIGLLGVCAPSAAADFNPRREISSRAFQGRFTRNIREFQREKLFSFIGKELSEGKEGASEFTLYQ